MSEDNSYVGVVILVIILLLIIFIVGHNNSSNSHSNSNSNQIIGVWNGVFQSKYGLKTYTTSTFLADGTYYEINSNAQQQPIPPAFPYGVYGSLITGRYTKTGTNTYSIVATSIVNEKDTSNENLPGIPCIRLKYTSTVTITSSDHMIDSGSVSDFDIKDTTLSKPHGIPQQYNGSLVRVIK